MHVDLNCDMGESFGTYQLGLDEQVMPLITSANVACGFHAGDPQVLRRSVELARKHGAGIGAHVSFPDLVGFGRREMNATPLEVENDTLYQLGAIGAFCRAAGVPVRHIKPHGALYNMAQKDRTLADAIVRAVVAFDPSLLVFAQPGSALEAAAQAAGLTAVGEVFADRAYNADGTLASRKLPGAVIHDPEQVAERAVRMVTSGSVTAIDGTVVPLRAETICVHGDTPGAVDLIRRIRERLGESGVTIAAAAAR
ncbi:MAG TPA: 5-oxoprolinase subunit PxpA [Symbiobacteriaceae bacterium]|jgi:5-oxoprolinase (ATP-hydrolysing) subunit A|nr:5-oxoprolinase subunit PxpA [Symbiobacteriaceae bacterium]HZW04469.1 5-oxoprolinase subunit PxpA [Anaerolineaceae bacterium]